MNRGIRPRPDMVALRTRAGCRLLRKICSGSARRALEIAIRLAGFVGKQEAFPVLRADACRSRRCAAVLGERHASKTKNRVA
ncbi:MAG: hypothetical protein E5V89_05905 [Mesorhizobium sp.]|nr:MAG: hypothetical protein E5V89_05905 [Mesorhizobium sp.]